MHLEAPVSEMCVGLLVATSFAPALVRKGVAHFVSSSGAVFASIPITHGYPKVATASTAS